MTTSHDAPARPSDVSTRGFADLGVPAAICTALASQGLIEPFPIQQATVPDILQGRDVLGRGRTGSGKTLAFGLGVIGRLSASSGRRGPRRPRGLILAPTRELVAQIERTITPLARLMKLSTTTVFGGVGQRPQVDALARGVDIVIATPGRLEDLISQRHCDLGGVEICVLDEADHMADLGFLPVVKRLLDQIPRKSQHLLFSATLDGGIGVLVNRYLHTPVTHSVDSEHSPVEAMTHHVLHITDEDRLGVILDLASAPGRTIVFTRTKHRSKTLAQTLNANGVPAVEMHGNLSQNARTRNLAAFADGSATTLVATDIAARGIHVDEVTLVIHADPPLEHKAYLHRSGRTARAGHSGVVVTLALPSQRREVSTLMRRAALEPTVTSVTPASPVLTDIAPGERHRRVRPHGPNAVGGVATAVPARRSDRRGSRNTNRTRPSSDQRPNPHRRRNRGRNGTGGRA